MSLQFAPLFGFAVEGIPKAQPRARRAMWGGVFNPPQADAWKKAIILAAAPFVGDGPYDGPVQITMAFQFPRPKRLLLKKVPEGFIAHPSKPDLDNLAKSVMDALTIAGLIRDDAIIFSLKAQKYFAPRGQAPGVLIQAEKLIDA